MLYFFQIAFLESINAYSFARFIKAFGFARLHFNLTDWPACMGNTISKTPTG